MGLPKGVEFKRDDVKPTRPGCKLSYNSYLQPWKSPGTVVTCPQLCKQLAVKTCHFASVPGTSERAGNSRTLLKSWAWQELPGCDGQ